MLKVWIAGANGQIGRALNDVLVSFPLRASRMADVAQAR